MGLLFGTATLSMAELERQPPCAQGLVGGNGGNTDLTEIVEAARAAGVPDTTLNRLLLAGVENRDLFNAMPEILCFLIRAHKENLPLEPLIYKIEEALAKRVQADKIITVLRREIENLDFARKLVRETLQSEEKLHSEAIIRLAEILRAGITKKEMDTFFKSTSVAPLPMRIVGVEIMAYCRQIHVDPDMIKKIIDAGIQYEGFTSDWRYLAKVIATARKRGLSDELISKTAIEILKEKGSVKDLMTELGFTNRDLRREPIK
ncbi:MAG: hypothetical protein B1H11_00540 [Desulfobacteraceae bacterium 4484_190.1]|nr:MAG: hypothetical protein B1H11_00540 [Desulfobacteraceae bacterium 4484_190.1]